MKGLILKDVMCLKKQLTVFCYVIVGVIIVSLLYVLSARFGNLAEAGREMMRTDDMSHTDVRNIGTLALVLFMLLPIATIGDMANVFEADGKAGFARVSAALPVPRWKRLLSRYCTIYALFGIGVLIDVVLAAVLGALTDIITFSGLFGIIISCASIMSIYSALVIFFCILLGYGKEQYVQILSILVMAVSFILVNIGNIRKIANNVAANAEQNNGSEDLSFLFDALNFIKEKYWVLLLIAAGVSIGSYAASLALTERKRGVI